MLPTRRRASRAVVVNVDRESLPFETYKAGTFTWCSELDLKPVGAEACTIVGLLPDSRGWLR
jgi:hypothetical protein